MLGECLPEGSEQLLEAMAVWAGERLLGRAISCSIATRSSSSMSASLLVNLR